MQPDYQQVWRNPSMAPRARKPLHTHKKERGEKQSTMFAVGDRVTVEGYECDGTVQYFGPHMTKADGKARVGVELDKPVGKNNGTVGGHAYFDTADNCGVLVQVRKVTAAGAKGAAARAAATSSGESVRKKKKKSSTKKAAADVPPGQEVPAPAGAAGTASVKKKKKKKKASSKKASTDAKASATAVAATAAAMAAAAVEAEGDIAAGEEMYEVMDGAPTATVAAAATNALEPVTNNDAGAPTPTMNPKEDYSKLGRLKLVKECKDRGLDYKSASSDAEALRRLLVASDLPEASLGPTKSNPLFGVEVSVSDNADASAGADAGVGSVGDTGSGAVEDDDLYGNMDHSTATVASSAAAPTPVDADAVDDGNFYGSMDHGTAAAIDTALPATPSDADAGDLEVNNDELYGNMDHSSTAEGANAAGATAAGEDAKAAAATAAEEEAGPPTPAPAPSDDAKIVLSRKASKRESKKQKKEKKKEEKEKKKEEKEKKKERKQEEKAQKATTAANDAESESLPASRDRSGTVYSGFGDDVADIAPANANANANANAAGDTEFATPELAALFDDAGGQHAAETYNGFGDDGSAAISRKADDPSAESDVQPTFSWNAGGNDGGDAGINDATTNNNNDGGGGGGDDTALGAAAAESFDGFGENSGDTVTDSNRAAGSPPPPKDDGKALVAEFARRRASAVNIEDIVAATKRGDADDGDDSDGVVDGDGAMVSHDGGLTYVPASVGNVDFEGRGMFMGLTADPEDERRKRLDELRAEDARVAAELAAKAAAEEEAKHAEVIRRASVVTEAPDSAALELKLKGLGAWERKLQVMQWNKEKKAAEEAAAAAAAEAERLEKDKKKSSFLSRWGGGDNDAAHAHHLSDATIAANKAKRSSIVFTGQAVPQQAPPPTAAASKWVKKMVYLERAAQGYGFNLSRKNNTPMVKAVDPSGSAHRAGAAAGDMILEVNGNDTVGCPHFRTIEYIKATMPNKPLVLLLHKEIKPSSLGWRTAGLDQLHTSSGVV